MSSFTDSQGIKYSKENYYYIVGDSENPNSDNNADVNKTLTKAIIPSKTNGIRVFAVGKYAFRNSKTIEYVFIPSSIRELRYDSFAFCTKLSHFEFADNSQLKTLERGVFYSSSIKIVNMPKSVKELGYLCFGQTAIESLFACSKFSSIDNYIFGFQEHFKAFPLAIYVSEKYPSLSFSNCNDNIIKSSACYSKSIITMKAKCSNFRFELLITMILIS